MGPSVMFCCNRRISKFGSPCGVFNNASWRLWFSWKIAWSEHRQRRRNGDGSLGRPHCHRERERTSRYCYYTKHLFVLVSFYEYRFMVGCSWSRSSIRGSNSIQGACVPSSSGVCRQHRLVSHEIISLLARLTTLCMLVVSAKQRHHL